MALTGLQIQKLLPATNCKECGSNTCLAFAMKLAGKKAELSQCPYASDEAKRVLGAASEPPVRCVELGPDRRLKLGGEVVLYRHEKTFVHQTALGLSINDTDAPDSIDATLKIAAEYLLERVGEKLRLDVVAVTQRGTDAKAFAELAAKAWDRTKRPVVLRSADTAALAAAAVAVKGSRSVLCAPSPAAARELCGVARENDHALALSAPDLDQLVALATEIKAQGFNDLFLQFPTRSLAEQFQASSIARRAALKDNFKPLGYPTLRFVETGNLLDDTIEVTNEIIKYGGICVLPEFDAAQMASLMTLRLNIYTDPQKPIQVEPRLYAVGTPGPDSPLLITTNFSLTYFSVSGEIEGSGKPAWLLVADADGQSVLTGWAAGKFDAEKVVKTVKQSGIAERINHRKLVLPGLVAGLSGEVEEELPGWQIMVGPRDAVDIPSFLRNVWDA